MMKKDMTVISAVALMMSLLAAAAAPKSDGYYGKTKVAPNAQVKTYPFDLGQVKLLPGSFERAMKINPKYPLDLDADRMLWPYHDRAGQPTKGECHGGRHF